MKTLSAADFLVDAAIIHFGRYGKSVRAFVVAPETFEEIAAEPDAVKTGKGRLKLGEFLVFALRQRPPHLVDQDYCEHLI